MEQTPSQAGTSPELPSVNLPSRGEGEPIPVSPERAKEGQFEQESRRVEREPVVVQSNTAAQPDPVAAQQASQGDANSPTQPIVISPSIANDDDLIEKEWVEKAKKVLSETKDDPYRREQEVSRLQEDYIMKRYGRKLGTTQ